jgi:energy-coupling factor transporter ATP-binding protein EcfA2
MQMYNLNLEQTHNLIKISRLVRTTVLVQGHMGSGKSSLLKSLAAEFPNHVACYFDCTTKSLGDVMIPKLKDLDGNDFVRFAPNEEFGVHFGKPVILMIDEYGKADASTKNALLRVMQEFQIGSYPLPEGSMVFATTNLGAEGVGDLVPPQGRNRITVVKLRKSTAMELIEYGISDGWEPLVLGWIKDNPHCMQSYEDVKDPDENRLIFHPRSSREAFVTNRSLHKSSKWLSNRHLMDRQTLTAALIGTIGEAAAMDMATFIDMADKLPTLDSIKNNPDSALIPSNAAAVCMVVYRVLGCIEREWVDAWHTYLQRLPSEAQAMFVNGVRSSKYNDRRRAVVMNSPSFTQWVHKFSYLFGGDK